MKLSRLLKCLREYNPIRVSTSDGTGYFEGDAGNIPFWLTQRQILSTNMPKGKLSVVVSEE
jgi:hypothetical protein